MRALVQLMLVGPSAGVVVERSGGRALVVMLDFRIGNARLGAFDWPWRSLHRSMTSPIWMTINSGDSSDLPALNVLPAT
jgi:hypothetical protein